MDAALCQLVNEPAVNGSESQLTSSRELPRTLDVIEHPSDLRPGKIRIQHKPCLLPESIDCVRHIHLQVLREISRPAALPHDGVTDRLPGLPVPENRRLALIGDTDRRNVLILCLNIRHRLPSDIQLCLPDFICVVLNPARVRKILCKFLLRHTADMSLLVKQNTSAAGCPGIKCHHILCHALSPFILPPLT